MAAYSDIERILKEGMRNRALLTTEMNSFSTHSTTVIFQVRFVQKYLNRKGRMINKTSLISFIDLPAAAGRYKTVLSVLFLFSLLQWNG